MWTGERESKKGKGKRKVRRGDGKWERRMGKEQEGERKG